MVRRAEVEFAHVQIAALAGGSQKILLRIAAASRFATLLRRVHVIEAELRIATSSREWEFESTFVRTDMKRFGFRP